MMPAGPNIPPPLIPALRVATFRPERPSSTMGMRANRAGRQRSFERGGLGSVPLQVLSTATARGGCQCQWPQAGLKPPRYEIRLARSGLLVGYR